MSGSLEPDKTTLRAMIVSQFHQVAIEHGRMLAPLTDELKLVESGLDSLGVATVVLRLTDLLGRDPFNFGFAVGFPVTFGGFVRMYATFLAEPDEGSDLPVVSSGSL